MSWFNTYTERLTCSPCGTVLAESSGAPHRWSSFPGRSSEASTGSSRAPWWYHWLPLEPASQISRTAQPPRKLQRRGGLAPLCRWPLVSRPLRPKEPRGLQTHTPLAPLFLGEEKRWRNNSWISNVQPPGHAELPKDKTLISLFHLRLHYKMTNRNIQSYLGYVG